MCITEMYIFFYLYTCFMMLGHFLHRITIVSFNFIFTEGRGSSTWRLVVADGTVSCHDDNLWCHLWWQASRSFVLGAQNRALSAFLSDTKETCSNYDLLSISSPQKKSWIFMISMTISLVLACINVYMPTFLICSGTIFREMLTYMIIIFEM